VASATCIAALVSLFVLYNKQKKRNMEQAKSILQAMADMKAENTAAKNGILRGLEDVRNSLEGELTKQTEQLAASQETFAKKATANIHRKIDETHAELRKQVDSILAEIKAPLDV
jgi:hypothetical protein